MKYFYLIVCISSISWSWAHPIKMTSAQLNFNDNKAHFLINFFEDDFEAHLQKTYRTNIDFDQIEKELKTIVQDYINKHLTLVVNGEIIVLHHIKVEKKANNIIHVTLTSDVLKATPHTILVTNTLLFEAFENQSNILHILLNGEKHPLQFISGDSKKRISEQ